MSCADPIKLARLRWRCRRGMRELDAVLTRFFDGAAADLDTSEISRFAALLDLPDPELYGYLLGRHEPADANTARLVERIRRTVGPAT